MVKTEEELEHINYAIFNVNIHKKWQPTSSKSSFNVNLHRFIVNGMEAPKKLPQIRSIAGFCIKKQ